MDTDPIARLQQDLQIVETAIGLDIWTRRDVRRGMLGDVAGGAVGLFLALWNLSHAPAVLGLLIFLVALGAVLLLKDFGYRNYPPSPGTRREVDFYGRFYATGSALIGCYYIWGAKLGMGSTLLFPSCVIICGLWYLFYALSAPSRSISLVGAAALIICGFALPAATDFSQMLTWLGVAGCLGCWFEAALLSRALHSKRDVAH